MSTAYKDARIILVKHIVVPINKKEIIRQFISVYIGCVLLIVDVFDYLKLGDSDE